MPVEASLVVNISQKLILYSRNKEKNQLIGKINYGCLGTRFTWCTFDDPSIVFRAFSLKQSFSLFLLSLRKHIMLYTQIWQKKSYWVFYRFFNLSQTSNDTKQARDQKEEDSLTLQSECQSSSLRASTWLDDNRKNYQIKVMQWLYDNFPIQNLQTKTKHIKVGYIKQKALYLCKGYK